MDYEFYLSWANVMIKISFGAVILATIAGLGVLVLTHDRMMAVAIMFSIGMVSLLAILFYPLWYEMERRYEMEIK